MARIGEIVSSMAGRSLARSVGASSVGPVGLAMAVAIPAVARRLSPVGLVAAAVGAVAFNRWLDRRIATREALLEEGLPGHEHQGEETDN